MKRVLTVLMLATSGIAHTQQANLLLDGGLNSLIATRDSFSINVFDQVKDGCLPHPNALRDHMEISLRKNGFGISKASALSNAIVISALGHETTREACAVHIRAFLEFPVTVGVPHSPGSQHSEGTIVPYIFPIKSSLLTGSKHDMQQRLETWSSQAGDRLYLDISRARDDTFSKFPEIETSFKANR